MSEANQRLVDAGVSVDPQANGVIKMDTTLILAADSPSAEKCGYSPKDNGSASWYDSGKQFSSKGAQVM